MARYKICQEHMPDSTFERTKYDVFADFEPGELRHDVIVFQ